MSDDIDFTPTGEQHEAIEAVLRWFSRPDPERQVFRLFGPAGTGKTTLARHIVERLGLGPDEVYYAAFTGKAAYRLRQKGCHDAMTIHKLIYTPVWKSRAKLDELEQKMQSETDPAKKAELARELEAEKEKTSGPGFVLNPESPLRNAKLCVIDEVSMVDTRMAHDLLSFDTLILVLGDPSQLPPVRGTGWFTDTEPDVLLTEPMRFGGLSSVIEVATAVRLGAGVTGMMTGSDGGPISGRWPKPLTVEQAMRFDAIICWRNDTRWRLNRKMRSARGFTGDQPNADEKIIMLANNYDLGVYNGQEGVVADCEDTGDGRTLRVQLGNGDDSFETTNGLVVPVLAGGFAGRKQQEAAEREARMPSFGRGVAVATFAHAITCHKSQGSDWGKVLVIDESHGVRYMSGDDIARRWMYTAVTRAIGQVVIAPDIS